MIEAKLKGQQVAVAPHPQLAPVVDLMEALKKSLAGKQAAESRPAPVEMKAPMKVVPEGTPARKRAGGKRSASWPKQVRPPDFHPRRANFRHAAVLVDIKSTEHNLQGIGASIWQTTSGARRGVPVRRGAGSAGRNLFCPEVRQGDARRSERPVGRRHAASAEGKRYGYAAGAGNSWTGTEERLRSGGRGRARGFARSILRESGLSLARFRLGSDA